MSDATYPDQIAIPCAWIRGGTSKALFFHEKDLPPAGAVRDHLLKRAMGTPDVLQIDGLGGSRLVTSKIAIIRRSTRSDADVDYTFAQVDIDKDVIGYEGNCGNISSAVGPFAVDEGLIDAAEPITTVRIFNTNTSKILIARVPVADGKARVSGTTAIAGVPGTGAEILMDYTDTVGSKTGKLLPSGNVSDTLVLEDGRTIEVSLCDAGNPCVFIAAGTLGISGSELPDAVSADQQLMKTISEIQAKAGQLAGFWDWKAALPGLPPVIIVAPPDDFVDAAGDCQTAASMDLRARLVFLGKCHDSMAGTGSICSAAASRVRGSVVNRMLPEGQDTGSTLRIGHPLGVMEVKVESSGGPDSPSPEFTALGFTRTARRLMEGKILVPADYNT
ncbi:2-methylaconitate cis-trans isomerase PrpF family protein [Paraburkholderia fungorum]|uniref:PrpF protein n=1 Tax=Paraburkholderia fungorum TaxID=134537 RepID=A0A3R7HK29_9BURK|nr:PrpF domain-containing protein [Paraburkholderia fungorum]RKF33362.1 PrpF protein [Paraburkholderia fungorum]